MRRSQMFRSIPAAAGLCLLLVFSAVLAGCGDSVLQSEDAVRTVSERIVEAIPEEEMAAAADAQVKMMEPAVPENTGDEAAAAETAVTEEAAPEETAAEEAAAEDTDAVTEDIAADGNVQAVPAAEEVPQEETAPAAAVQTAPITGQGRVVVLDPGHSANIPSGSEPLGPGSAEMKSKDTVGTRGTTTGLMEYELVFNVCLALQNELTSRGYTVYMTRSSHNDSVSCRERAEVANNAGAAVFLRVHADGAESISAHGASVLCISGSNPYTAATYPQCRKLSDCVISAYCTATGCYSRGVFETDQMSGNNWSRVPTALIELGFMTNPEEDTRMASADYQALMVQGLANGIDAYFAANAQ